MKMKIRCCLLALLLLGSSGIANAGNGIKRSEWDYRPEITVGNAVYWLPLMWGHFFLARKEAKKDSYYTSENLPWWFPGFGFRQTYLSELDVEKTNYSVNEFDWANPEFSIGYGVNYTSKQVPFGFHVKVAYDHLGFRARINKKEDWIRFSKNMIVPEATLKILFGNYRTSGRMVVVSLGASYDYVFSAKGLHDGKETVNSGFSGIAGIAYSSPEEHAAIGVNIAIPFYDYFNKSFSPDGGMTYPYENAKEKGFFKYEIYFRFGF